MPKSSLEALAHETKIFNATLDLLKESFFVASGKSIKERKVEGLLDDLENIILTACTGMPQHIAQKAKQSFKALREEINQDPSQSPEFLQLSSRLNSQANLILRRVDNLLNLGDGQDHKSANGIILAQEEERKRISREIHDGPAQTLASLTMRIDYCLDHEGLPEKLLLELQELKQSVIRSLKDIRRFIFDLRPMALDDLGLIPTIEQFISGFKQRTGVPVYVDIDGDRLSLSPEKELAVFRVIQEASNNAVKHAAPTSVYVFLKFGDAAKKLSVVIKDNGKGFKVEEIRKNYGSLKKLGLLSMEERVRLSGGEIDFVSELGEGTIVSFWVPLDY